MRRVTTLFLAALFGAAAPATEAAACALHSAAPPVEESRHDRGELQLMATHRDLRFGDDTTGRARLREESLLLRGAFYLPGGLGFAAHLPVTRRRVDLPNGSTQRLQGTGDLGVELRYRAGRDGPVTWQGHAGALLPTAPFLTELEGRPVHPDVQLGAGVVVPRVGAALGYSLADAWTLHGGADFLWAPTSPDGVRRSATARLTPSLRFEALPALFLDVTLPLRWESPTRIDDEIDPNTGGLLQELAPSLSWHPGRWSLQVGASLPVVQALRGEQREAPSLFFSSSLGF